MVQPTNLIRALVSVAAALALGLYAAIVISEPFAVRQTEGTLHGFLVLRALDGTRLAAGDVIQTASGGRVTIRVLFRFSDGSIHDETSVISQRRRFKLISYHLVLDGPSFPQPLDMAIDGDSGQVSV